MVRINFKITRTGVTGEQKRQLVADFTDSLVRVLGKNLEDIHIVIDEDTPAS